MTGTIVILLIALVWLFVLGPWYINRHRPISKAGSAFDDTRVIHEGGSGTLATRRRPKLTPAEAEELHRMEKHQGYEEDALIDDYSYDEDVDYYPDDDFDQAFSPGPPPEAVIEVTAVEPEYTSESQGGHEDSLYTLDDAYLVPGDFLYPDPDPDPVPRHSVQKTAPTASNDDELSDEDLAFAAARRGRGGYDPEADRRYATSRYQRRQRTVFALLIMLAIAIGAAVFFGQWTWAAPAVCGVLVVMYLSALRAQSRKENELRHRRIQQLRRARLGVRNSADDELGIPNRLRRPGAVVLEIDDDSPDFLYLETVDAGEFLGENQSSRGSDWDEAESLRVS